MIISPVIIIVIGILLYLEIGPIAFVGLGFLLASAIGTYLLNPIFTKIRFATS